MKGSKWLLIPIWLLLVFACGSDVEMDQNLNDPRNIPGQNDNNPSDDDSNDDNSDDDVASDDSSDNTDNDDTDPDDDGDGIANDTDQCPGTPSGENIDENGCSDSQMDSDGDGVKDNMDQCPGTAENAEVDEFGCTASETDGDGDGILNDDDVCPNTPQGEEVDEKGCSDSQNDDDNDGVVNSLDECPDTPNGEEADEKGCSDSQRDSDGDGVNDQLDQCPGTAENAEVDENGCTAAETDGDGDGVLNDDDHCPNTPQGEMVDGNGCSDSQKDADNDGVSDSVDECPDTPTGEEANVKGCSASQSDSDGDGVANDKDQCENTPSGETVDASGCSDSQKDSDGDGVSDAEDQCAETPSGEEVDEEGCSESQLDQTPPVITNITVDEITETSFGVSWSLDEGSKGFIRLGTSSGNYTLQTAIEENLQTFHRQSVGGTNPEPLQPNTTYYWQIYTEDKYGNSGYSEEQSTTTLAREAERTYVPDDGFEQFLIDLGFDDVMDDYVLTEMITEITLLNIESVQNQYYINDWTGIQDFLNLETLNIRLQYLSTLEKLETAPALRKLSLDGIDQLPVSIRNFPELEEFLYLSMSDFDSRVPSFEISDNPKLNSVLIQNVEILENNTTGDIKIANNPALEKITAHGTRTNIFEVQNNPSLSELILGDQEDQGFSNFITLNNNSNLKLLHLAYFYTSENISILNSPNILILSATGEREDASFNKIDLSQFTFLEELYLSGITSLDIANNTALNTLEINSLNFVRLSALDVSNNELLTNLKINDHALNCIRVNQSQLDNIPGSWEVSPPVPYSLDCN